MAEPHWARREAVRARSDEVWKRGVGLASQVWYGGGGPPSYAWIRVGSDGRAVVVTAMQDIGTGTRTVMAQIAAEELGVPLNHVRVELGDSARGPFASLSAGSSTTPSMGPAVRAAAADAKRQLIEIAAQRYHLEERVLDIKDGQVISTDGGAWPLEEVTGLLEDAQILGKGARGPNPTGMRVLTFGIQVAEVAVDVETGEIRVERIAAIHDVGRIINPLGAQSQVEGGIIQGIGHTLSEERLLDPQSGATLTQTLDSYKLPTIADMPEIVCEFVDKPDEHLTNLGSKGLGEPPIIPTAAAIANAIRDATGAEIHSLPITREEMLAELEVEPDIPQTLREACALAASPQLRSMSTIGGNLLQATRCWYWRLKFPCYLHGGDTCHAKAGQHREHAIFGNARCASAHPSDPAAALLALGAQLRTTARALPLAELYRLPTDDDRNVTALEPGELILELEVPQPQASVYLKAMERRKWSFAIVGVAAARFEDGVRLGLAGVAPIPWALPSPEALEQATPLPGTAYKVQIARALIRRALETVGAPANV